MGNKNSDLLDEGLQAVMGKDRCLDVSEGKRIATAPAGLRNDDKFRKESKDAAVDASWAPVKTVTYLDKIRECVKYGLLFSGVSGLLFYWQQAGLLASSAAVPSLIVCALGAGLTIGWHAR